MSTSYLFDKVSDDLKNIYINDARVYNDLKFKNLKGDFGASAANTVNQAGNKGADVTCNESCVNIIGIAAGNINNGDSVTFNLNNSKIAVNSIVLVSLGECDGDNDDAAGDGLITAAGGKKEAGKVQIILTNIGSQTSTAKSYHVNVLVINS